MPERLEVSVKSCLDRAPEIPGYECYFVATNLNATMQKTFIYRKV